MRKVINSPPHQTEVANELENGLKKKRANQKNEGTASHKSMILETRLRAQWYA